MSLNNFGFESHLARAANAQRRNGADRFESSLPASPEYTLPSPNTYALVPYDFATVYDLLPLWNAGIDGTGQTLAIVGQTQINLQDTEYFRSYFGLR